MIDRRIIWDRIYKINEFDSKTILDRIYMIDKINDTQYRRDALSKDRLSLKSAWARFALPTLRVLVRRPAGRPYKSCTHHKRCATRC